MKWDSTAVDLSNLQNHDVVEKDKRVERKYEQKNEEDALFLNMNLYLIDHFEIGNVFAILHP